MASDRTRQRLTCARPRLALLLAAAVVAAAVPARAGLAEPVGLTCGWAGFTDTTGAVDPDPNRLYGEVDAGPLVAPAGGEPVISTTVTCTFQLNDDRHSGPDVLAVSATGSGNVVVLPPTLVTFRASPEQMILLCTAVTWHTRSGTTTWEYDASDWYDGVNCGGLPEPGPS